MRTCGVFACLCLMLVRNSNGQVPPRLQIPGAVLLGGPPQRPQQFRQARLLEANVVAAPPRLRRPPPNAVPLPIKEIRPVVEEPEEAPQQFNSFDDEVNKLGISVLQSAVRDAVSAEEAADEPPRPLKSIPVLRENIREVQRPIARPAPIQLQRPAPIARPQPVLRAEPAPIARGPVFRGDVAQRQFKQQPQEEREEAPLVRQPPLRQAVRQQLPRPHKPAPRPYDEEDDQRRRKPVVQILRKYRTDNPDGSITWGFENDDGTFKEETLGVDCVTRGKYGYIDPDGVKREYNYETGNKCDQPFVDEEDVAEQPKPAQHARKPSPPQFRPQPGLQYAN